MFLSSVYSKLIKIEMWFEQNNQAYVLPELEMVENDVGVV